MQVLAWSQRKREREKLLCSGQAAKCSAAEMPSMNELGLCGGSIRTYCFVTTDSSQFNKGRTNVMSFGDWHLNNRTFFNAWVTSFSVQNYCSYFTFFFFFWGGGPLWGARLTTEWEGTEQDQLPCWPTETSSGNCQETDTCMVPASHTPRQPLENHPSGHPGGWATPWSAEETLSGQHQSNLKSGPLCPFRPAYNVLPQEGLEEDLCWIVPRIPTKIHSVKGPNWTELRSAFGSLLLSGMPISLQIIAELLFWVFFF